MHTIMRDLDRDASRSKVVKVLQQPLLKVCLATHNEVILG